MCVPISNMFIKWAYIILMVALLLPLSGCIGSPEVEPVAVDLDGAVTGQPVATVSDAERADIARAEAYRAGLEGRIIEETTKWRRLDESYAEDIRRINSTDLTKSGKFINNAEKERMLYNSLRLNNVLLYDIEISKLALFITHLEELERSQAGYDIGKAERTGIALREYRNGYEALKRLRNEEKDKIFNLPMQAVPGELYNMVTLGDDTHYKEGFRGSGPSLADPEQIKGMFDLREMADEYDGLVR